MDSIYRLSVVLGLTDNMTGNLSDAASRVSNSTKSMNEAFGTMQKAGAALAGVGAVITTACLATVTSTFDTQDALGELASLGVTDLQAVESAAKNFSDTWAGTTKSDFITAAYDIKSGIASLTDEGVAQFTELAALTGKATKSTTEEMGSLFATGYGIYKGAYEDMSDLEFGEMFSAGIATAVKNYKTAGSEMASAISMLGATATNNKVSMEEQLAILGQLQTTMSGSEAATKYKSFLNTAASAGEKLGLSFVDVNNQLLSTPEILEMLKGKYGDTIDAVEKQQIKEAFGTDEAVAMIDLLYNDIEGLTGGIDSLAAGMQQGTTVTNEMAEAIQNTPAQKFEVLKQQIHNNVEELGNGLLPVVNETMDKISGVIQKGSEWISENQKTVQSIMNIVLRIGVLLIVIGTLIGVIGTIGKAVGAAKTAIHALKGAWTVLSAAFSASPVGWVVIGIVALVAVFVLLWNKCEAFRNFFIGLFEQIKGAVLDAWSALQPALENLGQKFMELYEAAHPILEIIGAIGAVVGTYLVGVVIGAIQGVLAALTPITDALSHLISFVTNIINAIVALFKGDFAGACDFISAAVGNVKDFFISGFEAILSFISGFVDGFLDTIGSALGLIGINADEAIAGVKTTVSNGLNAVRGFFGSIMGAAADTVKEKLENIKNAYEVNGGGIKGVTAAAMEGVKGVFSTGLTLVDNLTGGKLSEIRAQFTEKLEGVRTAVGDKLTQISDKFREKITAAGTAVREGIETIKGFFNFSWKLPELKLPHFSMDGGFSLKPPSVPKIAVKWFADGGVMTQPTIFGGAGGKLLGGGEAGDEAILPLSSLWEKMGKFIHQEMDTTNNDQSGVNESVLSSISRKEVRTISASSNTTQAEKEVHASEAERKSVIQKVELNVDLKSIKELPLLLKLINELQDAQNSADDAAPETV